MAGVIGLVFGAAWSTRYLRALHEVCGVLWSLATQRVCDKWPKLERTSDFSIRPSRASRALTV